jgi:cytochrome P450
MTEVLPDPLVFPFTAPTPIDVPAEFARLRAEQPVARVLTPSGHPAWLLTRYADVRRVLSSQEFSREATTAPGAPRIFPVAAGSKSIFVMDPPEHTRLRRLVSRPFSPTTMASLAVDVERRVGRLLDGLAAAGSGADVVTHLAKPLPIAVICALLGVPEGDVARFGAWTDTMLDFGAGARERVVAARDQLSAYLAELVAAKRTDPRPDVLTELVTAHDEQERLSTEELIAFGYTLLGAGYHATAAQIVYGLLALLRAPDQAQLLRTDPGITETAVAELLRVSQTGGLGSIRIATVDVELSGTRVRAGEAVLPSLNAANRDPAVFADPDRLDLRRSPNRHLAFGHGIHNCLGAQLGRLELGAALTGLLRRFPDLALGCSEGELRWRQGAAFRLPETLPVTWGPR